MNELNNIKDFDEYLDFIFLNESLTDGSQSICNKVFENSGPITFEDGTSVNPKEIIKVVNDAINYLSDQFTRTFKFGNKINIIYLRKSSKIPTMAVDEHMNLYMNAGFIYHTLKMDKHLVAAVIMHEVFHVLFNHLEREKNWIGAKGKSQTPQTHHDANLAADVEVNRTLVRLDIIDEETLTSVIKGIYLKNKYGNSDVVPMEVILDNEEYMNKLRSMCPSEPDPGKAPKNTIKTTDEWNKGYKEGWNKIASIIKKYGYRKAWEKLQEAGIVTGDGELNGEKEINDVMTLEFIQIKNFDEYNNINESFEKIPQSDQGKTYDAGFISAVKKLIGQLHNAVEPSSSGMKNPGGGTEFDTDLKSEDLDNVDLPSGNNNDDESEDGKGLPQNITSNGKKQDSDKNDSEQNGSGSGSSDENKDDKKQNNQAGQGGEGKSDDEITDDDLNKLANDLKNKSGKESSESNKKSGNDIGGVGGTGSFIDSSELGKDDILKDAGYSKEDIDAINEVRERNKERNSEKGIEKARQEVRNSLRNSDPVKKYLDAIEIESNKYKNVWKKIMEHFLANKTRRAGTKINDVSINWKRKSRIALGNVGPQYQKVDNDPQDVNVYVDVSGSVDLELLEIISKSLVEFSKMYKYSGINICPWASTANGISSVNDFSKRNESEVTDEILKIISKGIAQCGGGTEAKAAIAAMVDIISNTLENPKKKKKDDVHVVITDGYFDYKGIENRISNAVKSVTDRPDVAEKAPENTFWMIYDSSDDWQESWKNEIKKGKLIFINSSTVKGNK